MSKNISSESEFVWKFIWNIFLTPITLIYVLFGKKRAGKLLEPFRLFFEFVFEPRTTITLIIINIIIFVIIIFLNDNIIASLINFPSDFLSLRAYTLITSGFLHADISHLLFNMLALFIFGRIVEKHFGTGKTLLIYFGALIISGLFSSMINLWILENTIPELGASGAIMGLVATAILINPFYLTYEFIIPLPIMIVGWITIYADIIGILDRTSDGIGHFAHLGGFLSIAILTFIFQKDKEKIKKGLIINVISLILLMAIYYLIS